MGKEERIRRLSAVQESTFAAVKAMEQYTGVDDATVSSRLGL